jgi:hypothetical protein
VFDFLLTYFGFIKQGSFAGIIHYVSAWMAQKTVNNRKLPHMLPQYLDIFKISGTVDSYCISNLLKFADTFA